jgi:hypothetical protein
MYTYYHGIIDHSGINFKAYWWQPWQPDAIFHDNHHQYFHVNFAFNCSLWDKVKIVGICGILIRVCICPSPFLLKYIGTDFKLQRKKEVLSAVSFNFLNLYSLSTNFTFCKKATE